jgi:hypothetical protein
MQETAQPSFRFEARCRRAGGLKPISSQLPDRDVVHAEPTLRATEQSSTAYTPRFMLAIRSGGWMGGHRSQPMGKAMHDFLAMMGV